MEIIENKPYSDGPGGDGQYTLKIYHVGSHLPGWFKSLLPKSALIAKEEAWNAYPYTKTRYTCPFVEKLSVEVETYYLPDNGHQDNVFQLNGSDYRNRIVGRREIPYSLRCRYTAAENISRLRDCRSRISIAIIVTVGSLINIIQRRSMIRVKSN